MNRRLPSIVLALAAAAIVLAVACGRAPAGKRVIVLGFDGMDYRLTQELMAKGRMPNFSNVASSGAFGPLGSVTPPQSPVAWSTFITGMDPGGHGIFDFIHRDPATMVPYLSTTRTDPAPRTLTIGSWQLPISSARVTLLRDGQPFWEVLEHHGIPTTIMRMPANFPPSGTATRELAGMGTPDILGTYGTFTFFTSAPGPLANRTVSGGRVTAVDVVDDVVQGELVGPDNPFRTPAQPVTAPFTVYLDAQASVVKLQVGDEERVLTVGEWSDWVPVEFPLMPLQTLRGMSRFYLKQTRPAFELYASPINLDPVDPAMPISTPASFAADLARTTGRFYTQGIAEDTKALSEHVLTRAEFLQQAALVGDEVMRQYHAALDGFDDGLLFYHFGNLDQVSHMMWRARDPGHPAFEAIADAPYRNAVEDLYVAFDRIVGDTLQRVGADTTVIVMSDHGFASWRRAFHLNTWLKDNGYLAVLDQAGREDSGPLGHVDWSRTRAYGLGLNGLYVNLKGREKWGIVDDNARGPLLEEIRRRLLEVTDPTTGRAAVTRASLRETIYRDSRHFLIAPDLIVGYAEGMRVSNESALGETPPGVMVNNLNEWSGDHCMDADAVPGILLTSRPLRRRAASLEQVAGAILAEFGIEGFPKVR